MCPTVLCDPCQLDQLDPLPNRRAACESTTALAVTPDLAVIAVGTKTSWGRRLGELLLVRPASDGEATRLPLPRLTGGALVRDVSFSADGGKLVAVVHGREAEAMVCCWDVETRSRLWTHLWSRRVGALPGMDCAAVCFSRDGRRVATASGRTGDVAVWDVTSGRARYEYKTASSGAVALDATGNLVAHLVKMPTYGPGQRVVTTDIRTGQYVRFPVALSWVNGLSFAADLDTLAVVGERVGGTAAAIVELQSGRAAKLRMTPAIQPEPPQALHPVWSRAGVWVAFGCHDGAMVWDIERDSTVAVTAEWDRGATAALTPCGGQLVMASPSGVRAQPLPTARASG